MLSFAASRCYDSTELWNLSMQCESVLRTEPPMCYDRDYCYLTSDLNRGILIYNICLIGISNSVSDGATNKSVLNIERS